MIKYIIWSVIAVFLVRGDRREATDRNRIFCAFCARVCVPCVCVCACTLYYECVSAHATHVHNIAMRREGHSGREESKRVQMIYAHKIRGCYTVHITYSRDSNNYISLSLE